ncbi:preprotein translocase subunit SecY [Gehongia tenuis]|uniref:Protein translocase subunit SecY n=1 Tax=Gehongia tenuis TaxID=2763655 RepID=A0A926HQC0_9FIRM|nr:preprotein translocase subunit SecY [Gehongia tenuis]MBC8531590.1 preprotein translocase subunit SecY [Gehongia tenuis]
MIETLKNAWRIPELRKKILYTLLMLLVFRLGSYVPVPGVDTAALGAMVNQYGVLGMMDIIAGGSFSNFTLFAMGITPYINASIIINLLTVAIPKLERLSKEGEEGRKKIAQYTRYFTIVLAFIQSIGIIIGLGNSVLLSTALPTWLNYVTIAITLTAGTALTMWIGERITEKGIGNGISLLIFAGIVAKFATWVPKLFNQLAAGTVNFWVVPAVIVGALVIIVAIVFVDMGQRRIPVQYAKRVVGRKMYGGQSTHIPVKVNSTGVMPLIFAMALVNFPMMIAQFWPQSGFYLWYSKWFGSGSVVYFLIYALLIIFFTYFYTQISFNPIEISKNMQQQGGFIPGIRPGKPTSDYLKRINNRVTMFGALFLAVLAVVPTLFTSSTGMSAAFSATGLLIVVNVALETSKQLESQMLMRHYKGFLK